MKNQSWWQLSNSFQFYIVGSTCCVLHCLIQFNLWPGNMTKQINKCNSSFREQSKDNKSSQGVELKLGFLIKLLSMSILCPNVLLYGFKVFPTDQLDCAMQLKSAAVELFFNVGSWLLFLFCFVSCPFPLRRTTRSLFPLRIYFVLTAAAKPEHAQSHVLSGDDVSCTACPLRKARGRRCGLWEAVNSADVGQMPVC